MGGVSHARRIKQHRLAPLLPPPLFILFSQLSARRDLGLEADSLADVEVVGSEAEAEQRAADDAAAVSAAVTAAAAAAAASASASAAAAAANDASALPGGGMEADREADREAGGGAAVEGRGDAAGK